jgi:hypothetical protein
MSKRSFMRTASLTLVMVLAAAAPARAGERPRGVIELFTSQGCSSCPAADRILGELARDPSLVVLSLPVDYWDYIGWKDTLASPACTARQKGYAGARGDGQVYTPQAVIDGVAHVIGADLAAIDQTISSHAGALKLDVAAATINGHISVDVGAGAPRSAAVWLFEVQPTATVEVGRGENAGRSLAYTNIVRKMTRLGDWTGAAAHFEAAAQPANGDSYIALVQAGTADRPGAILGAARAR